MKSLFNWRVMVSIVLALAIFVGLVLLTFRWLDIYTNHGKEVPVPNVMNQSVHEAIRVLDEAGLEYEVDSAKYDPKYKAFQVLAVFPKPGSRVKDGRTIVLRVNPRTWAKVTLPDILNKYKGLAFRRLEQVGLTVGDTIYEPNIQRDAVIRLLYNSNEIKPGVQLPRFSAIDIVIGTGPKRNIPVPNLVGLSVTEARQWVQQNLFEIGIIEYDNGENNPNAIIYYQDPAPGALRDQGMQIDLWASKKSPSQLQEKIKYLNSIYRIRVDTTLAPIKYEEIPAFEEPVFEKIENTPAKKEAKTTNEVKPANNQTQGQTSKTNDANKNTSTPAQPKTKIIME